MLLILSLCVSTPVFASEPINDRTSAEKTEISGWQYIPKATEAPTDGYFGDTDTARITFEALKTTRLERDAWKNAVHAISGDIYGIRSDFKSQLRALNDSFEAERDAARQRAFGNFVLALLLGGVVGLVAGGR